MNATGIFLCTCDRRIARSVDVATVAAELRVRTGAARVASLDHACLPDGRAALQSAIHVAALERVVIAACPARYQAGPLRQVCAAAGVPPEHVALVDWREGCAWPQRGADRAAASAQAADLVAMGYARVMHAPDARSGRTAAQASTDDGAPLPRVLVVGAGVAGRSAAEALGARGCAVTLVDRAARIEASDLAAGAPIELRAGLHVSAVQGVPGDYAIRLERAGGAGALVHAGAIVVATGARELRPVGRFRYDGRRVLTLGEQEERLAAGAAPDGATVYLLCAGARDERVPYCSQVCCQAALRQALRVRRAGGAAPGAAVTVLFRDLYLGDDGALDGPDAGMPEELVREARAAGIAFARYAPDRPPRVDEDAVEVDDVLAGSRRRITYDRLVLATPLVPQADAGQLAHLLQLPRDGDGFFIDAHERVRPEHHLERGIYVCGSAHRPAGAGTARLQGLAAAARAARFVQAAAPAAPARAARVDPNLCTGCAQCAAACGFEAIRLEPPAAAQAFAPAGEALPLPELTLPALPLPALPLPERIAQVNPYLCSACGSCAPACPSKAIELPESSDRQIFAQVDAALAGRNGAPRVLAFGCTWSGFAAMELAGARRLAYPAAVRTIELPCSARLDPLHVLYALMNGADGVLLALCPPGECHFAHGNRQAEQRVERLRAQLAAHGLDPRRLAPAAVPADDARAWVEAVGRLTGGGE
jgi:heterodisulfide reductase subunit A